MTKVFVIIKTWGEYSDAGSRPIASFSTKKKAGDALSILKEYQEIINDLSKSIKIKIDHFKINQFPDFLPPEKPSKSKIDPENKLTQGQWLQNYIEPYKRDLELSRATEKKIIEESCKEFDRLSEAALLGLDAKFNKQYLRNCFSINQFHYYDRNDIDFDIYEMELDPE